MGCHCLFDAVSLGSVFDGGFAVRLDRRRIESVSWSRGEEVGRETLSLEFEDAFDARHSRIGTRARNVAALRHQSPSLPQIIASCSTISDAGSSRTGLVGRNDSY